LKKGDMAERQRR